MSEKLGPLNYGKKEEHIFLGREIAQHRDFSENTAQDIDGELRRIVTDCFERAKAILYNNMDALHAIANRLLEKEVLDGQEIEVLIQGLANAEEAAM
jgi:cell division protease FtsH